MSLLLISGNSSAYQFSGINEHMDCLFALFLQGPRLQESSLCQSPLELAGEALTVMNRLNCALLTRRCDRRLVIIIMWCWRETEF